MKKYSNTATLSFQFLAIAKKRTIKKSTDKTKTGL
jgi:hypothetical protein